MKYEFVFDKLTNYKNNLYKEWLLTNGIGGYSNSSIIGAHLRAHQGYLIASLNAPTERFLAFSKTNERLVCGSRIYDLTTAQHKGPYASEFNQGNMHLKVFKYDGTVTYIYEAGGMRLSKTISLVYGKNQCVIAYTLENDGPAAGVVITPLMNFREHGSLATVESLKEELPPQVFAEIRDEATGNNGFYYSPVSNPNVRVSLVAAGCEMVKRNNIYDENMELQLEADNEKPSLDCHLKPYDFVMEVAAGGVSRATFVCTVDVRDTKGRKKVEWPDIPVAEIDTAFVEIEKAKNRTQEVIEKAGFDEEDELSQILSVAADQFIVDRKSTGKKTIMAGYPALTDCGADAMLALTGLCLETKRYEDAKSILLSFAKDIKNGLIPNDFPEDGKAPKYNSADASLWYFYAVYNYIKYVNTDEAWKFVEEYLYSTLQEIMGAYRKGTTYSIRMDDDALMAVGSVKHAIINALWYNALMTMEEISRGIARRTHNKPENFLAYAGGCSQLAMWVKEAFNEEFWYEEGGHLYDTVGKEEKDETLSATQIFAVSLPFTMLDAEKEKSIVRALSEKEYFGAYIEAYLKVYGKTDQCVAKAKEMLAPIEQQLVNGCIGSLSEGDYGCVSHACVVGEIIRAIHLIRE